ncbi:hypothetical protein [Flectobacillus major]|uniref:hypothetical protein n=1 Tax=Flectobacillus major TaxID=103 RepID=UPI0004282CD5|nr:hypothetical protein [Flectobacillus major]
MKKTTLPLERERDFGDKINDTFTFVKINFKIFVQSIVLITGPVALIAGIFAGLHQVNVLGAAGSASASSDTATNINDFLKALGQSSAQLMTPTYYIMFIATIIANVLLVVVVYSFMQVYRESTERVSFNQVLEKVKDHFRVVLRCFLAIVAIMMGILLIIGLAIAALSAALNAGIAAFLSVFLFLPLIYFAVMFSLCPAIIVFEYSDVSYALGRAKYLITNKWWSTFGIIMVMGIINYFLSLVFTLPAGIIMFLKIFKIGSGVTGDASLVITTTLSTIGSSLVSALSYVAIGLQYFNLVEKKEGNSLFKKIENIGQKEDHTNDEETY